MTKADKVKMAAAMAPMLARIDGAFDRFVALIVEHFGYSAADGAAILGVLIKAKAVKLDAAMGRYGVVHGAYWDRSVLDRALAMAQRR